MDEHKAAVAINEVIDKMPDYIGTAASEVILETDLLPKIDRDQKLLNEVNEALAHGLKMAHMAIVKNLVCQ